MRSFSAIQRSSCPSSSVSVRSTSFAPAGFLISRIETLAAVDRDRLHAPERAAEALERLADRGERHAQLERGRRGGHGVVDVVEAGEREIERELALGRAELDARAAHAVELDARRRHVAAPGALRPQFGQW